MRMNARAVVLSILMAMAFAIPSQAHAQELWGALTWTLNHYSKKATDHYHAHGKFPVTRQYFAGMSWNFRTKKEAFMAARKACRDEYRKSSSAYLMDEKSCGSFLHDGNRIGFGGKEDLTFGNTTLGKYFRSGECAAYASGMRGELLLRRIPGDRYGNIEKYYAGDEANAGDGYGASKEEAEKNAMDKCIGDNILYDPNTMSTVTFRGHTCKITMSACIK